MNRTSANSRTLNNTNAVVNLDPIYTSITELSNNLVDLSTNVYDLSTNYYAYKTSNTNTVIDLSTSHYDLSANYYAYKTSNTNTLVDLSTSHYDLSANYYAYKTSNTNTLVDLSTNFYDLSGRFVTQATVTTSTNLVQSNGIKTYVDNAVPSTQATVTTSTSLVESNGIKTYVDNAVPTTQATVTTSTSLVESNGIKTYVDNAVSGLQSEITTSTDLDFNALTLRSTQTMITGDAEIDLFVIQTANNEPNLCIQHGERPSNNPIIQCASWLQYNTVFINKAQSTATQDYQLDVGGIVRADKYKNGVGELVIATTDEHTLTGKLTCPHLVQKTQTSSGTFSTGSSFFLSASPNNNHDVNQPIGGNVFDLDNYALKWDLPGDGFIDPNTATLVSSSFNELNQRVVEFKKSGIYRVSFNVYCKSSVERVNPYISLKFRGNLSNSRIGNTWVNSNFCAFSYIRDLDDHNFSSWSLSPVFLNINISNNTNRYMCVFGQYGLQAIGGLNTPATGNTGACYIDNTFGLSNLLVELVSEA